MTTLSDYRKLDTYAIINHCERGQVYAYPNGHGQRCADLCIKFGKYLGYDKAFIKELEYAALLHDAGKITIDKNIVEKNGKLTPGEWRNIEAHPNNAFETLTALNLSSNTIPLIVKFHHKWYNGGGYPSEPIKETDIPLGARNLAIVDKFDAMTNKRVYRGYPREAMTAEYAIRELVREAHKSDPELLAAFCEMMKVAK
jgi:HD-GYP domain-containing protein (c-di-GMP phosphodiesterase class II)